jgi:predicted lipoprotein with Yx(FWY)xxD motif
MIRNLLLSTAALALLAVPAFAEDYLGGLVMSMDAGGKEVLTDAKGMTLYTYDKDTAGATNCYDKCAVNWPPLWAPADAQVSGDWSLVDRTDATGDHAGMKMVAYKGKPLYLWIKDTKPGDMTGDGVGGVWHTAYEE